VECTKLIAGKLIGNQRKLDINNDGKISKEDFKMLKPGKVKKANLGLMFMKKAKDKGAKGAELLSPLAMAGRFFTKGGKVKK
jgi:predicted ATP-dependent protease